MALSDNLVAYWKLDGNSNDAVGSVNGTDTDVSYDNAYGKVNNGASFNGSSSKIVLGTGLAVTGSQITVSGWIYLNAFRSSGYSALFSKQGAAGPYGGYAITIGPTTDKKIYFQLNVGGTWSTATWSGTLALSTWYHIVGTYDNSNMKVYVNNGTPNSTAKTGDIGYRSTTDTVGIGYNPGNNTYLNCYIDEVGIWSRALSASEVSELYNSGAGNQYPFGGSPPPTSTFTPKVIMF